MSETISLPIVQYVDGNVFITIDGESTALSLSRSLDGSEGENRDRNPFKKKQVAADNDVQALEEWLGTKRSKDTSRGYRKEVYRLMVWAVYVARKPISGLSVKDLNDFIAWLQDPFKEDEDTKQEPDKKSLPYSLIRGGLSATSLSYSLTVLRSLFRWLVDSGYLAGNPFALIDVKGYAKTARRILDHGVQERHLDQAEWAIVMECLELLPRETTLQKHSYHRMKFLVVFAYETGARRAELANGFMSEITFFETGWGWRVNGKGETLQRLLLTDRAIEALRQYRLYRDLPPYPEAGEEDIPIVARLGGKGGVSPWAITDMLINYFGFVVKFAQEHHPMRVGRLQRATTHWIRHTTATHQKAKGMAIEAISEHLRHKSIETTKRFYVADDEQRQRAELKKFES